MNAPVAWLVVAGLSGCGGGAAGPDAAVVINAAPATAPDLVLVGVAGLRNDPLSKAGDAFLAPFSRDPGVRFTNTWAQSPSTFVSLVSLLAGRYPSAVPICGFPTDPGAETAEAPWCTTFPDATPSLPSVLALYGYRTAVVTADVQGAASLAPLFQDPIVVSERWSDMETDWTAVSAAAQRWWDADESRPRLLVVAVSDLNVRFVPSLRVAMGLDAVREDGSPLRIERDRVMAAYRDRARVDGEATHTLLAGLRSGSRPRWAAVFGATGINMGESSVPSQALRDRSWSDILIDRTLHVPLAILGPGAGGGAMRTESQLVELVDLVPTLLARAGAVAPAGIPGQDLLAEPFGADERATAYAEFGDMLAVRQGNRMLSVRAFFHNRSALDPELTNFVLDYRPDAAKWALNELPNDPFQERNLLESDPAGARRMAELLAALRTGPGAPPEGALDPRKVWELRMAPADGYW